MGVAGEENRLLVMVLMMLLEHAVILILMRATSLGKTLWLRAGACACTKGCPGPAMGT